MHIGVIADDLTGATDIAGFLANSGLDTIQLMGVPDPDYRTDAHAAVVSLKSRANPAPEAVAESLSAFDWLRKNGCKQFYFKYCSTFDSTAKGNIGPVTDALLDKLGSDLTVVCPTLPINGRVVENGILLVNGVPLSETGMRHHPINPMTESDLTKLMDMQSKGKTGLLPLATVRDGGVAVKAALEKLRKDGYRYVVLDSTTDADLDILAGAIANMPLVTGGSGLGAALARLAAAAIGAKPDPLRANGRPPKGRAVALSGSCSEMTNSQVAAYKEKAPAIKAEAKRCIENPAAYAAEMTAWAEQNAGGPLAPLVYATVGKDELAKVQAEFGVEKTSKAVEEMFTILARELAGRSFDTFIVAGGETSGAVTAALGAKVFRLGPEIAPGVPWIRGLDKPLSLALKSGNFGDQSFFFKAQEYIG